jgi:hypothetical protein
MQPLPALAGTDLVDMGTGRASGTEMAICTRTHGTRIHVPAGYTIRSIPVSITTSGCTICSDYQMASLNRSHYVRALQMA